jgi:hypothetical protein
MIFGIIGFSLLALGCALNILCYAGITDYYNSNYYKRANPGNKTLKKKRILLILTLVPFLLCVLAIMYGMTIGLVKLFLNEWRG